VAATNQRLLERIEEGTFREDLYYRLQVILINLPPLRERPEEIIPIAEHYLALYRQKFNKQVAGFTDEAKQALLDYNWPGNIRELINAIERAVILARTNDVGPEDFLLTLGGSLLDRHDSKKADETENKSVAKKAKR
ncbi:sigma-54-dependent Fis family transcriptional regulator, partial [Escherichia coli]|nr:sigma-54-dependent Fis family transcriptional regulator [Escherichia coli]